MICNETGVLSPSEYFFFSPSEDFLRYNYGVVNCGHFYCQSGYEKIRQGNAFPLFLSIEAGQFHLEYEDHSYCGHSGDIILIDCSRPHRYYVTDSCEFYYFHFTEKNSDQVTTALIEKNQGPVFKLAHPSILHKPMRQMILRLSYDASVTDVDLSCMAYQCLCTLHATGDAFTTETRKSDRLVNQIALYIREHLDQTFTLKDLADCVNLSPYYFSHLFKKETGISPIEYVAVTKINYAKNILKTTQSSVSMIAEILGYSSDASFINAFKKRTGISPARFRREFSTKF